MHFAVTRDHIEQFQRHGWIEFESLLTLEELETTEEAMRITLKKRDVQFDDCTLIQSVTEGRDLGRDHPELRKIVRRKRFAEVATALTEEITARLAYDQLLVTGPADATHTLFQRPQTLAEISAVSEVRAGLLLALSDWDEAPPTQGEPFIPLFAAKQGSGIFISPTQPLNFRQLIGKQQRFYWLIVYCKADALYIRNLSDPHVHRLKKLGLAFGDRLIGDDFPLLIRR